MAHVAVTFHDTMIDVRSQGFCWKFPKTGKNKKAILPVLRAVYEPDTGNSLFTDQAIADALGYKARQIVRWSGQVSFDEKWIPIDGTWHFVLCAVDAVSGFPLFMDIYPTLDTVSWTLFFRWFRPYSLMLATLNDVADLKCL